MTITLRRFEVGDTSAIDRFNRRLAEADCRHRVHREDSSGGRSSKGRSVQDELFVAVDGDEIRGGAWLREQFFWVEGVAHRFGWIKYPVAESLIDRRFAGVPTSMVLQFLRRQPRLLALGMGGNDAPFARLLAGIGWRSSTIPILFRINRPFRVLRGLPYARRRWWGRVTTGIAAWTGVGWAANQIFRAGSPQARRSSGMTATKEARFLPWADKIWTACHDAYPVLPARDGARLEQVYPPSVNGLHRLRIARAGSNIGWACVQILPRTLKNARYFGDLSVGLVTDALAMPGDAVPVLALAVEHLDDLGVDIVITYFSHGAWIKAARHLRFAVGPSNFPVYRSPAADRLFSPDGDLANRCHFTRHLFGEDALSADGLG